MSETRRTILLCFTLPAILLAGQQNPPGQPPVPVPPFPEPDTHEDDRLPNGKSRSDAIAKQQHQQALKDTDKLISLAQQLKAELQKAGDYVVPVSSVKKTEQIEKLARSIRGKLKT